MFVIREAVPEDAPGITIVNVYTWKTAYTGIVPDELIDRRIAELLPRAEKTRLGIERGGGYLVAVEGNAVVASCLYGPCRDGARAGAGEIYALYALAGVQGHGAGAALFRAATEKMRAQGLKGILVDCLRGNPALGFYLRLGGTVVGTWADESSGFRLEGDVIRFD